MNIILNIAFKHTVRHLYIRVWGKWSVPSACVCVCVYIYRPSRLAIWVTDSIDSSKFLIREHLSVVQTRSEAHTFTDIAEKNRTLQLNIDLFFPAL